MPTHVHVDAPPVCKIVKRQATEAACTCAAGDADAEDDAAEALDLEGREAGGTRAAGRLAAVHVASEAEAAAGAFDVADVVLPLPGARIRYPEHITAQVCHKALHAVPQSWL